MQAFLSLRSCETELDQCCSTVRCRCAKVTLKECGRQTKLWNKFAYLWRDDKEVQLQKWSSLSSLTPAAFNKRFYFYT